VVSISSPHRHIPPGHRLRTLCQDVCLLAPLLQDLARTKMPPTRRNNPATSLLLPSVAVTRLLPVPGRSAVADWAPTAGPVRPLLQVGGQVLVLFCFVGLCLH
jgi:hypothetical protein